MDILTVSAIGLMGTGAWVLLSYNRLVSLRRRCQRAEADIDVYLRHRHDLIPRLVETVRGFVKQETGLFNQLMDAYKTAVSAASEQSRLQAENIISSNLQNVLSSLDSYPEVQSSSHFLRLRDEISDTENKLAAARRFLNLAADEYNAALDRFPGILIAPLFGLKPYRFYTIGADRPVVEQAPAVHF